MKDSYYFPHFQDARRDIKILRVRKDLGIEGYGIYFMILEILREQSDFSFPLDDIELLVKEVDTTKAKVEAVIGGYDLFQIEEKENGKFFFSPKQIQCLLPFLQKKEQTKLANAKSNLLRKEKLQKQINQLSLMDSSSRVNVSEDDSSSQRKKEKKEIKEIKKTTPSSGDENSSGSGSFFDEEFLEWIQN